MSLDAYLEQFRRQAVAADLAVLDTVDSTNLLARAIAVARPPACRPPLIVIARRQTAGRGRLGRRWASPEGQGIYTSLLLSVADAVELAGLPMRAAVALCEGLAPALGRPCGIKWPNDLEVEGRKLGGLLIEALGGPDAVVVGYGLNACQDDEELPAAGATSIRIVTGAAPDLPALAVGLAARLVRELSAPADPAATLTAYRRLCVHRPGEELRCRVGSESLTGSFAGFDRHGRLRLRTAAGERLLSGGEIVEVAAAWPRRAPRAGPVRR